MKIFENVKRNVVLIVVVIVIVILLASSVSIIKSGTVGVVSIMGKIQDNVFQPGLNFKIPFISTVIVADVKTQKFDVETSAASKDLQTVTSRIVVNYHIDPDKAASLYKNVGREYVNTIMSPVVQEALKAVTAQFSAEELITQRQVVSSNIKGTLVDKFLPYGLIVDEFNITSLDFSAEFNAAIEAKQTAQQTALKAEQDLARIQIEAQQKIVQAEADAKAIEIIQTQLAQGDNYIKYLTVEKWDGVLPKAQGDGSYIIDLR